MKNLVFVLGALLMMVLCGCSSCPKTPQNHGFDSLSKFKQDEMALLLPASYELMSEHQSDEEQLWSWRGPHGLVRIQRFDAQDDMKRFQRAQVRRVQSRYKGIRTQTVPISKSWLDQEYSGSQIRVILPKVDLALDLIFIPTEKHVYQISFQREKSKEGVINATLAAVEQLFWDSLCLKN